MAINYEQQVYQDYPSTASKITAARLNHTEKGVKDACDGVDALFGDFAAAYNPASTYAVGQYCIYSNGLYRCTTAITTPEAWNASHWTATTVGAELKTISDNLATLSSDSGWIDAALINGWSGTLKYRRIGRVVQIYMNGVTNAAAVSGAAFNMPVGYRPNSFTIFEMITDTTNDAVRRCAINAAGDVFIQSLSGGANTAGALHQGTVIYTA